MATKPQLNINEEYDERYGFHVPEKYVFKAEPGLNEQRVKEISWRKEEPSWMLEFRLRAYKHYINKPMPTWANTALLNSINLEDIYYYLKPTEKQGTSWDEVPEEINDTFERLGIPEACARY